VWIFIFSMPSLLFGLEREFLSLKECLSVVLFRCSQYVCVGVKFPMGSDLKDDDCMQCFSSFLNKNLPEHSEVFEWSALYQYTWSSAKTSLHLVTENFRVITAQNFYQLVPLLCFVITSSQRYSCETLHFHSGEDLRWSDSLYHVLLDVLTNSSEAPTAFISRFHWNNTFTAYSFTL